MAKDTNKRFLIALTEKGKMPLVLTRFSPTTKEVSWGCVGDENLYTLSGAEAVATRICKMGVLNRAHLTEYDGVHVMGQHSIAYNKLFSPVALAKSAKRSI